MKISYIKRITAAMLSAFCLLAFSACRNDNSNHDSSITDSSANASSISDSSSNDSATSSDKKQPLTDLTVLPENTYDGATIVCDDIVVAAGTTKVPYRVMLYNNPGYGFVGMRVFYDTKLQPYMDEERGVDEMEIVTGDGMNGFMSSCMNNTDQHLIGLAAFGSTDCRSDGVMITCYFDIPADAASGTVYDFSAEVVDFRPLEGENHAVTVIGGKITVQ